MRVSVIVTGFSSSISAISCTGEFQLYWGCAVIDFTVSAGVSWCSIVLLMFVFTIISSTSNKSSGVVFLVQLAQCSAVTAWRVEISAPLQ